jgi:hypothetical protein
MLRLFIKRWYMHLSFTFPPDPGRARFIDSRMRLQLADSLEYLHQSLFQQMQTEIHGLAQMVANMRQGAIYPPSTFGLYYEIASALIDEDFNLAQSLFEELLNEAPCNSKKVDIITLGQVSKISNLLRYQRLMDTDPTMPFHIESIPDGSALDGIERFQSALHRLRALIPELAEEFNALVRSVILVQGGNKMNYQFAGGSSYTLWGALFINAELHTADIATIEALAHESAHSLLFGFTIDEPLVLNPDEELYSSPLRYDPRPMDGIYHATFVSARMCWAMKKLLESGALSSDENKFARHALETDRVNFFNGYETVAKQAQMTETGHKLMQNAYNYMQQSQAF